MAEKFLFAQLALLLVLVNGFFVAAEFAIVRLRHAQAAELARTRGFAGRVLGMVLSNPDGSLSACRLGITFASLGLGWIGVPAFARLIEPLMRPIGGVSPGVLQGISFAVAFLAIAFLHVVFGELAPKSLSIRRTPVVSLWTAVPLYVFHRVMSPFIRLMNGGANLLLRIAGVRIERQDGDPDPAGIGQAAPAGRGDSGRLPGQPPARAVSLDGLTAGDVMRRDTFALDARAGLRETLDIIGKRPQTRYPVYDGDPRRIVGLVELKDLFAAIRRRDDPADLRPLIRRALVVDVRVPAARLLEEFREGAPPLAVVNDEQGAVAGLVTIDDLLEALIGNAGGATVRARPGWSRLNDGSYAGAGSLPLYSLERLLGVEITAETDDSIGGLIMSRLDRIPRTGDNVPFAAFDVEVLAMHGVQVAEVRVRPSSRGPAENDRLM